MSEQTYQIEIEGTPVLQKVLDHDKRIQVHEGGSGSSKTFSICQAHIVWAFEYEAETYSIVRKTMPALYKGAYKDFKDALNLAHIGGDPAWTFFKENKTLHTFENQETGTLVEFFSLDDPQKGRGPRRHRLYMNEANEMSKEDFTQLSMRTRRMVILDYNPSMLRSWIYSDVLPRPDCTWYHSTYKDNPFLEDDVIREIESNVPVYHLPDGTRFYDWELTYQGTDEPISGDPFIWAVYGLGQRGAPSEAIYPRVYESVGLPAGSPRVYGLDFGYNHVMALTELAYQKATRDGEPDAIHIDEIIHSSKLTTADFIRLMGERGVDKRRRIWADGSRPESIEEIKRAGYNIEAAEKGAGSVYQGIMWLKGKRLCFTGRSEQGKEQHLDYRWKKLPDGTITDEPVKLNDDSPDSVRYGSVSEWGLPELRAAAMATGVPVKRNRVVLTDTRTGMRGYGSRANDGKRW